MNLGDSISQGSEFNITKIEFLGIGHDDEGLLFNLNGYDLNNWDEIQDGVSKESFMLFGAFMKSVKIHSDEVDLWALDNVSSQLFSLGKLNIPPIYLNISNHAVTHINTNISLIPNPSGIGRALKSILKSDVTIFGDANISLYLINGFVNVGKIKVPIGFNLHEHSILGL